MPQPGHARVRRELLDLLRRQVHQSRIGREHGLLHRSHQLAPGCLFRHLQLLDSLLLPIVKRRLFDLSISQQRVSQL